MIDFFSVMVSISSSKLIRERTREFCKSFQNWDLVGNNKIHILNELNKFLNEEYSIIPEKERIGKGIVYISRYVAKEIFLFLKDEIRVNQKYHIDFIKKNFSRGEEIDSSIQQHFALLYMSEFVIHFPEKFKIITTLIEEYANDNEWSIRESTGSAILAGLKKNPEKTLEFLFDWVDSENENLRQIVSESSRPMAEVKWLRDPTKNDKILELLTLLRMDPSIYVRKSVGNNLKDLSKYMPEKVLDLMEKWIKDSDLKVYEELATEKGFSQDEKRLIWTMKHAMRWIKERNPEYHPRLEKILGKNYILYFNEKKNRLAKPPTNNSR